MKFGADYRKMGVDFTEFGDTAGDFQFTTAFTRGPNPVSGAANTGDAFASFLLGLPATGNIQIPTKAEMFINYFGAYAQDDFRPSEKLTINFGLRYENETACRKEATTSWWDGTTITLPVQVPGSQSARRAALCRRRWRTDASERSEAAQVCTAGRVRLFAEHGHRHSRRLWIVLGPAPGPVPLGKRLRDPRVHCRHRLRRQLRQRAHAMPRMRNRESIPEWSRAADWQRWRPPDRRWRIGERHRSECRVAARPAVPCDWQRELPGNIAISAGYIGSRSNNLTWSGTANAALNINQLPAEHLALGAALNQAVPNPFLGTPLARGALAGATVTRGQLLRPFPQFTDVNLRRGAGARSTYNSAVFKFERRISGGWGTRVNYTFSRTNDNQLQETSFFGRTAGTRYLNVYDLDHRRNTRSRSTTSRTG